MDQRHRKTRWTVLVAVAALALATVGVAYSHWSSQLDATIGVQTGEAGVGWWDIDCGESALPGFQLHAGPGGGDTTARPFGVAPGDAAWAYQGSPMSQGLTQFTKWETNKNVAHAVTDWTLYESQATVHYYGTYPSFYDDCEMEFTNSGSIPIAVPYLVIEGQPGTQLASDIFAEDGHLWVEWSGESPPNPQVDPAVLPPDVVTGSLKVHVEQVAAETTDYSFSLSVCVHNWNEPTVAADDICDLYDMVGGEPISKTTGERVIVIPYPFQGT